MAGVKMRIRRFRGQSVAEFLMSFIIVWAMLLLVLGVSDMWNMRVLSVYAAIDGACKEGMSPGSGVSDANGIVNNIWPGQKVHAYIQDKQFTDPNEAPYLAVEGNYTVTYLINTFGKFLPNSATVFGSAGCPAQKFVPR
jgi:hypothetical protein